MNEHADRQRKTPVPAVQPADREEELLARVDHPPSAEPDLLARSPHHVLKLQTTIGNQAVQRLIAERAPDAVIQRDTPKDAPAYATVLNIVLGTRGKIKGGSQIPGHKGDIEVTSFSIDPNDKVGQTIVFMKATDDTTPLLMEAANNGDVVTSATFTFLHREPDGSMSEVHAFTYNDGAVTTYETANTEEGLVDSVSLSFGKKPGK